MLNIATADLGFKVMHLIEFADEAIKTGSIKPTRPVDVVLHTMMPVM
jgi:hypothetical protein